MKLYNSESRQVEEFKPNNPNEVLIYTCGPTVYHFAHIGNLRTYIMEDILQKSLEYLGFGVKRAMNVTDVGHLTGDSDEGEDKMLVGAKREHKTVLEIAQMYTEAFKKDIQNLNLRWPNIVVPATSCIDEYINIISQLLEKNFAYKSGSNIYFDTTKLSSYYRFGEQNSGNLLVGAREDVEEDECKRNTNDFVLWFTKSKFDNQALKWDSPWGVGYPGWHIECTGISYKYLGENLDIHCGGVDNKFPHHTNEIAQTESLIGHKWCKYWFHVEHLNTKTGKMSKSSGAFLTLTELSKQGYSPMVYKLFCLQSHYRRQLVFSEEGIEMAKNTYEKVIKRINNLQPDSSVINQDDYESFNNKFRQCLENDINTAGAITTLFDVLKSDINNNTKIKLITDFDKVFNLNLTENIGKSQDVSTELDVELKQKIEKLITERNDAKQQKNYALADEIRNKISALGVDLIDTKEGTIYKMK